MRSNNLVAASIQEARKYPIAVPYNPPERYEEYAGSSIDPSNEVYAAVRSILQRLDLDADSYGKSSWNPLGSMIKPGMTVFLKPNTVMHKHGKGKDIFSVVVHASVLRPILDYVCTALKGSGRIIVGDSELLFSNFHDAMQASGIASLLEWYKGRTEIPIELLDLRQARGARTWLFGKWRRVPVQGDSRGYERVDLGGRSMFHGIDPEKLRIAVASFKEMQDYHSIHKHEYLFPRSLLSADVVINIAKLKTHRRTGVTLALKNFMGLPSAKGSLPHFRVGSPAEGGDQYIHASARKRIGTKLHDVIQSSRWVPVKFVFAVVKRLLWESRFIVPFPDDVSEAMWPENDTVWRTLLDIHRIVRYADKNGEVRDLPQRQILNIIDGVVAGEGNGPLSPDPVPAGCILAGRDPVAVDVVATGLMGFDHRRIRLIAEGLRERERDLPISTLKEEEILVANRNGTTGLSEFLSSHNLRMAPHEGWKGHIERA